MVSRKISAIWELLTCAPVCAPRLRCLLPLPFVSRNRAAAIWAASAALLCEYASVSIVVLGVAPPEHNSPLVLLVVLDKLRVARIMRDTTCTDLRSFFACRTTFALGFAFCKPKCFSWSHCVSTAACGLWSFHRLFDGDGFVDHTVDSRRTPFFQHCDSCAADAVVLFVS